MIERVARLGYLCIGAVYIIVGLLAAAAARGHGGSTGGQKSAFAFLLDKPFGAVALVIIAIGLAGYAVWRFASAFSDSEHRGSDAKGLALRFASVARGVIYAYLATEVVHMLLRRGTGGGGNDQQTRHWTARLLEMPFGRWLVAAAGLGVVIYGAYQVYAAATSKLSKQLALGEIDAAPRRKVIAVSRFGIGARGVVFLVIGGSFLIAALHRNPTDAQGTSGAMHQIAEPLHGWLLVLIGFGLAAYGVYALVNARYRRIRA
ncbi:MAG TPA: DUF1206 domain-containing protein [Thermoanaerobaculia bacterium]|jgi:hypothetical protein